MFLCEKDVTRRLSFSGCVGVEGLAHRVWYQRSLPQREKETVNRCVFVSGKNLHLAVPLWGRRRIGEVPHSP